MGDNLTEVYERISGSRRGWTRRRTRRFAELCQLEIALGRLLNARPPERQQCPVCMAWETKHVSRHVA